MSVVVDVTGLPPERVLFRPSPLSELSAALHVLSEPAHHPGQHGWATTTTAALKPDLAGRLAEADFLWRSARSDILSPAHGKQVDTLAEELALLDTMTDEQFVRAASEISCSTDYERLDVSPLTDAGDRERALERAAARGPRQRDFVRHLLDDPPTVRAWIRRLLEDCEEAFFGEVWERVRGQLAADARHKAELHQRLGLGEALRDISTAITLDEDASGSRIVVDKLASGRTTATGQPGVEPGVTLVPSAFGWPHLLVLHAPGWRPVIAYPLSEPEVRTGPGSVELMERRLGALAHPVRVRLCRSLARAPYTTGELAGILGISAPEVSRHLTVLRKAGLLRTNRQGRYVQHQLDVTVVARIGSDFLEAVLR